MDTDILVRAAGKSEPSNFYKEIASIHKSEISEGFLSTLGISFLAKMYQSLSLSPYSFLIIAQENTRVVGFICGGINTGKTMKRFFFTQGIFVLPQIMIKMLSFKTIKKILETLSYPGQKANTNLPKAEIFNFCVSNEVQGKGIGKKLFFSLCERYRQLGIDKIKIVTGENQKKAQFFYEKLSAHKIGEIEVHKGSKSLIYTYTIV